MNEVLHGTAAASRPFVRAAAQLDGEPMQIGELAKCANVTVRTIRYYEELGLIEPMKRSEGGFRLYDGMALRRLLLVNTLRALDFPLKDIQDLMNARQRNTIGATAAHKLRDVLGVQLRRTDERIAQYRAIRDDIETAMGLLDSECSDCHLELATEPCKTCGYLADAIKDRHTRDFDGLVPIAFQALM